MPPRYAYWTIIVDNQATAFRSASVDELMPTFNRLQSKHPNTVLKWFQNGKLWDSRLDAREAQERRGERGRKFDANQGHRPKLEWTPGPKRATRDRKKLEWSPRPAEAPTAGKRARKPFKPATRPDDRPRDSKWRPGGDHRDPRQKYQDAKKAKWTRFKEAVRRRRHNPRKP